MTQFYFSSLHTEVRDYLHASEHLITAALVSTYGPLSKDEVDMIEYYLAEVAKVLPLIVTK